MRTFEHHEMGASDPDDRRHAHSLQLFDCSATRLVLKSEAGRRPYDGNCAGAVP